MNKFRLLITVCHIFFLFEMDHERRKMAIKCDKKRKRIHAAESSALKSVKYKCDANRSLVFNTDDILSIILYYCALESVTALCMTSKTIQRNMTHIYEGNFPLLHSIMVSSDHQLLSLCTFIRDLSQPKNMLSLVWQVITTIHIDKYRPKSHAINPYAKKQRDASIILREMREIEITPPKLNKLVINAGDLCHFTSYMRSFDTTKLDIVVYYRPGEYNLRLQRRQLKKIEALLSPYIKHPKWRTLIFISPLCEEVKHC